jgi:hypothetical protein
MRGLAAQIKWSDLPVVARPGFHANSSEQRESESRERVRSSDRQTLIVLPLRDAYLPAPVVTAGEDPASDRDLAMSRSRRQPRSAEDARHLPGASPYTVILNASTSEPRPLQMPTERVEIVSFDQRPPLELSGDLLGCAFCASSDGSVSGVGSATLLSLRPSSRTHEPKE